MRYAEIPHGLRELWGIRLYAKTVRRRRAFLRDQVIGRARALGANCHDAAGDRMLLIEIWSMSAAPFPD